jgi:transporter family-2 protein
MGQIVCSVVIDHFGLLGFATREASPGRLLGVAFIAAGVALVRFF